MRAAILAVVVTACSRAPQGVVDSTASDSSPTVDTASDTTATDTGTEQPPDVGGGYGPFTGAWKPFPGISGCADLVAMDPGSSVGSLKWKSCGSARSGCRELIVDWGAGKRRLEIDYPDPVRAGPGGQPVMQIAKVYNDPIRVTTMQYLVGVFYPVADDSLPIAAFGFDFTPMRDPPSCGYNPQYGRFGIVASKREKTALHVTRRSWTATSLSPLPPLSLPYTGLLSKPVGDTAFLTVTAAALHIETDLPRGIAVLDLNTQEVKTTSTPPAAVEHPKAVLGGTVARMIGPPWGMYFVSDSGSQTQILATAAGRAVLTHIVDRARADTLVWVEGTSDFRDMTLWESPLAKTMADLKPRKCGAIVPWWGVLVANAGVVLAVIDGKEARIIRTSDGARWTVTPEPGQLFKSALWVDDTEVWLTTAAAADVDDGPSGIMRMRRDALGSPIVDAGI